MCSMTLWKMHSFSGTKAFGQSRTKTNWRALSMITPQLCTLSVVGPTPSKYWILIVNNLEILWPEHQSCKVCQIHVNKALILFALD
jgi:hypothetical protein